MNALINRFVSATPFAWTSMLIQTLAWPTTVVVIAAIYRTEVRQLLQRLVRVKVRDVEAQFDRNLRESESLAASVVRTDRRPTPPDEPKRIILELNAPPRPVIVASNRTPREVIEDGWSVLAIAAGTLGDDPSRALIETGLLDAPAVLLFERLRQIYRLVEREFQWEPPGPAAGRYSDLARALAARIDAGLRGRRPI